MKNHKLYAFTGLMFSGKDYVAEQAKLKPLSVAKPIYELVEYFTGYTRKNPEVPGIRRLWQQIGQWGWGDISDKTPLTIERVLMTSQIRMMGGHMTKSFKWVDWERYGQRKDFWINICLSALRQELLDIDNNQSVFDTNSPGGRYAITNARFHHEVTPLKEFGFQTYHVLCSEATRQERMALKGYKQSALEANDISEQMAKDLMSTVNDDHVIWSDHRDMPEGHLYWTVAEFCNMTNK
jgi:hypothetical protein